MSSVLPANEAWVLKLVQPFKAAVRKHDLLGNVPNEEMKDANRDESNFNAG
jgi:hypothetical protein